MSSVHQRPPEAITAAPNVWIRNRRRTRAWSAIAVGWALLCAGLRLSAGAGSVDLTQPVSLILSAFYFGLAAAALVLAGRVARAGVRIGSDGVVIRGPFRTHRVALEEAERFAPGLQGAGGNGTPCPLLDRRGSRAVGVWALGQRNIWFRYARLCQEIQPLCDELNELLVERRTAGHG